MNRDALLHWYRTEGRDLPWRRDPRPYYVLLSELMLQQTRVETVIPYFERFIARWPTIEDLAAAEPEEVLEAWAGLGYYSRARNLHETAKRGLTNTVAGLRALPGIGPYTAGAIASIAYGVRAPLVDGNVERVLSRHQGLEEDPRSTPGKKALWALAADLVPAEAPGDFNQALMELGARICTPANWRCDRCPVAEDCVARATGRQGVLPRKKPKKKPKRIFAVCGLLQDSRGWLLGRRVPGGRLAGLWEPVMGPVEASDQTPDAVARIFAEQAGLQVRVDADLGEVVHVFTHRRLSTRSYAVTALAASEPVPGPGYDRVEWVSHPESVALSALGRKLVAMGRQPRLDLR